MATMPVYNMTDLWNSGGTTYDAIKMNVTDSASAAASRLMTLQVGSVDKSYITKAGLGYFAGGLLLAAASALVVGHTANLAINGNSNSAAVFGTTAATGGVSIGMFNATAGTGPRLDFYRSKDASLATATVVASGDALAIVTAYGAQQTGTFATQSPAAQWRMEVDGTVTSGAGGDMPGRHIWATTPDGSGTLSDRIILDSAGVFKPATNDGAALGKSGTAWSDAYFASGAVIDFNSADVTITHSANALTFAGASNGYLFDAAVIPQSNDGAALGSTANSWSDGFFASGAVLNFNNGDVLITHSANLLAFSGASSGYTFDAAVSSGTYSASGATAGWTTGTAAVATQSSSKTSTAAQTHYQFVNPNGLVGSITTNASATAFNTSSDQRLKENFIDLNAGSMIDAIKMYQFSWKADGTRGFGVKAQECFEVFPEAITVGVGALGDDDYMPWSADYSKFVPLLLAEVKALRGRLASAEAALASIN